MEGKSLEVTQHSGWKVLKSTSVVSLPHEKKATWTANWVHNTMQDAYRGERTKGDLIHGSEHGSSAKRPCDILHEYHQERTAMYRRDNADIMYESASVWFDWMKYPDRE